MDCWACAVHLASARYDAVQGGNARHLRCTSHRQGMMWCRGEILGMFAAPSNSKGRVRCMRREGELGMCAAPSNNKGRCGTGVKY